MLSRLIFVALLAVALTACETGEPIRRKDQEPPAVTGLTPSPAPETFKESTSGELMIESSESGTTQPLKKPVIIKGSGIFSGSPSSGSTAIVQGTDHNITLNFVDADIKEVVKATMGDLLKLSYTIDPKVSGKITLKTNSPLSSNQVMPLLERTLQTSGVAIVDEGGNFLIAPIGDIKAAPLRMTSSEAGYGAQIVRLHHIAASEMLKILDQYAKSGRSKLAETAPNLIMIEGPSSERQMLLEIVGVFDIDQFNGMSFGLFPIESANPEDVSKELEKVFSTTVGEKTLRATVNFVPIDRLNAILVISRDPSFIDQAQTWINRLDEGAAKDEKKLYVHYVQHGDAKQIADVLRKIFGSSSTSDVQNSEIGSLMPGALPTKASSKPAIGFENGTITNSFGQASSEPAESLDHFDEPEEPGQSEQSEESESNIERRSERIRIIADDANNALFILSSAGDYKLIDAAIKHLDVTPLQVLIEATIAEVTLNDQLKYGVEWFFKEGSSSFTFSDVASGVVSAAFPGFSYVFSNSDARVVVSALDKVTDVKVISSPQLMVLDNKTAKLQVGDQVPVTTQTAVTVDNPGAPIVNAVEFKDTGVILTVTPRVNSSGTVSLEIEQEVSDVVPTTTSTIDSPTIQQRKVKSAVTVEDGQTIALGGLIRDNQSRGKTGIPWLSDIPIAGNLFKTTDNRSDRTELLILITPRVVRNPADAKEVTDDLRRRLQAVTPLNQKIQ